MCEVPVYVENVDSAVSYFLTTPSQEDLEQVVDAAMWLTKTVDYKINVKTTWGEKNARQIKDNCDQGRF